MVVGRYGSNFITGDSCLIITGYYNNHDFGEAYLTSGHRAFHYWKLGQLRIYSCLKRYQFVCCEIKEGQGLDVSRMEE